MLLRNARTVEHKHHIVYIADIRRKLNYSNHKQVPDLTMALERARISDDEHKVAGKNKKPRMA